MTGKMTPHQWHQLRYGLLFCSPWLIGITAFILIPGVMSLYYSLCDYSVLTEPVYIGAGNYTDLAQDGIFWKALWNTVYFAGIALPLGTVLSLALALLLNSRIMGRGIFRVVFFVPSLVPLVALAMLWQYLLNPEYGLVNGGLRLLPENLRPLLPDWTGDPNWSKPAIVMTTLWGVGNAIVIYLAALQEVPTTLYESARVDGANWWQQTWNITLPMISPVIYFNVIIGTITVLQVFALPYVMFGAEGEPARSTLFYAMYLFNQAFNYLRMGYASAMAWVLFVIIAILTLIAHKLLASRVYYSGS